MGQFYPPFRPKIESHFGTRPSNKMILSYRVCKFSAGSFSGWNLSIVTTSPLYHIHLNTVSLLVYKKTFLHLRIRFKGARTVIREEYFYINKYFFSVSQKIFRHRQKSVHSLHRSPVEGGAPPAQYNT